MVRAHTAYLTIGLSALLHGISAAPLARRYADWYGSYPRDRRPVMEGAPAPEHRSRGAARSELAT